MTLNERRMKILEEEWKKPITEESAREVLIECGILNKDGTVAQPYDQVIVKKQQQ